MKKSLIRLLSIICVLIIAIMQTLPILAVAENRTIYTQMNTTGEIYKEIENGNEIENKIPIETSIKYYLNEQEISAEDIKGKNGKVKIEVNLKNKEENYVNIDGKEIKMYTPYLVACGCILENAKFTNINISSGKIINNGKDTVVIGIAMPGMEESLDLSQDINIPENIIIEADTLNFELGNIYIYIQSNLFEENSLDFLDEFESIYNDINMLKSASNNLVDGSKELSQGTSTFSEKIKEFNTGLNSYTEGVNKVNINYTKINEGIGSINSNTKKIADGSKNLENGIGELKINLTTLMSGLKKIKQGTDGIYKGVDKILNEVNIESEKINAATSENADISKNLKALGTDTGTTIYKLNITKTSLEETIKSLGKTIELLNKQTSGLKEEKEKTEIVKQIKTLETEKNTISKQVEEISKQINQLKINTEKERSAYIEAIKQETVLVQTGLTSLKNGLQTLQGVSKQVKNGVDQIVNNSPELQEGLGKLQNGSKQLTTGAYSLSQGTNTLSNGANELKMGIETLNSNSETISNAGSSLKHGAETISNGANTLTDGIQKFDSEGIKAIYNLINVDVKNTQTRLEKLMDLANKKEDTNYKYIIKTDSIK